MSAGGRTMAETTMHIGIGEEAVASVKAEFRRRMKSVRAARRNLGRLRDDLVRHNSMDRKTVIMMLDIVMSTLKRAENGQPSQSGGDA